MITAHVASGTAVAKCEPRFPDSPGERQLVFCIFLSYREGAGEKFEQYYFFLGPWPANWSQALIQAHWEPSPFMYFHSTAKLALDPLLRLRFRKPSRAGLLWSPLSKSEPQRNGRCSGPALEKQSFIISHIQIRIYSHPINFQAHLPSFKWNILVVSCTHVPAGNPNSCWSIFPLQRQIWFNYA